MFEISVYVQNLQCVFTSQLGPATFQRLKGHLWLEASALESTGASVTGMPSLGSRPRQAQSSGRTGAAVCILRKDPGHQGGGLSSCLTGRWLVTRQDCRAQDKQEAENPGPHGDFGASTTQNPHMHQSTEAPPVRQVRLLILLNASEHLLTPRHSAGQWGHSYPPESPHLG